MRVAVLKSRAGQVGGLEKYARRVAEAIAARGHEVQLLTTEKLGEPLPQSESFEVVSLGKAPKLSVNHLVQFDRWCREWLKANRCDVVFGMDRNRWQTHYRAGSGVHGVYLERRAQVEGWPARASFRLNPLHLLTLRYEREAFEHPDLRRLITNSEMVRREVLDRFAIDPERVAVVHNGVEWGEFAEGFVGSRWHDGVHRFLFLGHDYVRKGLGPLLRGLALLEGEWELTVVGKEKREARFRQQAEQLGLAGRIHWAGAQRETIPYFQGADTLVLPTLYDPCANVTLEALAMGLSVVTSRFNGASELLDPSSVIADLEEPESVAAALRAAQPKSEAGASGVREAIRTHDFPVQLGRLLDLVLD